MNYLKRFQHFIITEAAKKISDIISNDNICLYIWKTKEPFEEGVKTKINFILYDSSQIESMLVNTETNKTVPDGLIGMIEIHRFTSENKSLLKYRPQYTHIPIPYDCFSVSISVINKNKYDGWGPALYDLVIQYCGKNGLRPSSTLTPDSDRVWRFYMDNRPDIEKKPIDPIETKDPLTPIPEDDGQVYSPLSKTDPNEYPKSLDDSTYMNHVYFFKGQSQYEQFVNNHEKTLSKLDPQNQTKLENNLVTFAKILFGSAYEDSGGIYVDL